MARVSKKRNTKGSLNEYGVIMLVCLAAFTAALLAFSGPAGDLWGSIKEKLDVSFELEQEAQQEIVFSQERIPAETIIDVTDAPYTAQWFTDEQIAPEETVTVTGLDETSTVTRILRTNDGWGTQIYKGGFYLVESADMLQPLLESNAFLGMLTLNEKQYLHAPMRDDLSLDKNEAYWFIDTNGNQEHDDNEAQLRVYKPSTRVEDDYVPFWYLDVNNDNQFTQGTDQEVEEEAIWFQDKNSNWLYDDGEEVSIDTMTQNVFRYALFVQDYLDDGDVDIIKQAYGEGWNLEYDREWLNTKKDAWMFGYENPANCDPEDEDAFEDNCVLIKEETLTTILDSDHLRGGIEIGEKRFVHIPVTNDFEWFEDKDQNWEYDEEIDEALSIEDVEQAILQQIYQEETE